MKFIKKNIINYDNFEVLDEDNNIIIGLETSDFTFKLYNPNEAEVSNTVPVTISELGNGLYRASFTPDIIGNWLLVIYNTTYFPYGKANDYECVDALFDDIQLILGLVQHNFRIVDAVYDSNNLLISSTIKIYSNASDCSNDTNSIATYSMIATYDSDNNMNSYKVIKN
ncbi:MAG: hypothetical protein ACTSWG_10470 [Candidatus Helarchaeota archaeon]